MSSRSSEDLLPELPAQWRHHILACRKAGLDLLPWIDLRRDPPTPPILDDLEHSGTDQGKTTAECRPIRLLGGYCDLFDRTDLTAGAVEYFLATRPSRRSDREGLTDLTIGHDRRSIRKFVQWLLDTGRLTENPLSPQWRLLADLDDLEEHLVLKQA